VVEKAAPWKPKRQRVHGTGIKKDDCGSADAPQHALPRKCAFLKLEREQNLPALLFAVINKACQKRQTQRQILRVYFPLPGLVAAPIRLHLRVAVNIVWKSSAR
jgi:hypothetical protein